MKSNTYQRTGVRSSCRKTGTRTWLGLTAYLLCSTGRNAAADPTEVFGRIVSNGKQDATSQCDSLLGYDVDVCRVYVRFSETSDKLHVIGFSEINTSSVSGLVQVPALQGGGNTAPSASAISTSPVLICDSFLTIGIVNINDGQDDCSATAPDFNSSAFNTTGGVLGSWYCNNPLNAQGNPTSDGSVLIGQFTVPAGSKVEGEVSVFFNTGNAPPFVGTFTCGGDVHELSVAFTAPPDQGSLWRTSKNILRITLNGSISAVPAIEIREMLAGGSVGPDLSSNFNKTIEGDNVIRLQDTGSNLQHRHWYVVRNVAADDLANFFRQFVVQVGDADANRFVTAVDIGQVNASPAGAVADNSRFDIDGNGFRTAVDVGLANAGQGGLPQKPLGW